MTSFTNVVISLRASESDFCYTRSEVTLHLPQQHQQLPAHPYDLQLLVFVEEQLLQVGYFHHRLILHLQQLLGHLRTEQRGDMVNSRIDPPPPSPTMCTPSERFERHASAGRCSRSVTRHFVLFLNRLQPHRNSSPSTSSIIPDP